MADLPNGLDHSRHRRKKVLIIGGGDRRTGRGVRTSRAGNEPIVLEAQNRVGGRILTLRTFAPGLYAEAGAMRIPRVHGSTLDYCRAFGLELRPFIMECAQAPLYLAGRRWTYGDVNADVSQLPSPTDA